MAFDPLSPEVVYALKGNLKYPGTQTQATAAVTAAQNRLNDALTPATVTVPGTAISPSN